MKWIFPDDNYTSRIKVAKEFIKTHNLDRIENYSIMKEAVTESKLYIVSSANRRDNMDKIFLAILL